MHIHPQVMNIKKVLIFGVTLMMVLNIPNLNQSVSDAIILVNINIKSMEIIFVIFSIRTNNKTCTVLMLNVKSVAAMY